MSRPERLILVLALGLMAYVGWKNMAWNDSDLRDVERLLGPAGAPLAEGGPMRTWQPDPNAKPQAYYLQRDLDAAALRRLAGQAGLDVVPVPDLVEAVWRLPPGLAFPGWAAQAVPPGGGLQASGDVGEAVVFLRWQDGKAYLVVMPSAP